MSEYFFSSSLKRIAAFLVFFMAICSIFSEPLLFADNAGRETLGTILFIDPGHGGQDTGARSTSGLLEKTVTLALAETLEGSLKEKYTLRLSRNDDYNVDLHHRVEAANNQNATLFISLHTGGSFRYAAEGFTVYYYSDTPGRLLPEEPAAGQPFDHNSGRIPWYGVQYRHAAESRLLARSIQLALAGEFGAADCKVRGAPLLVLSAANMPAVLIETGCLNNPAAAKNLGDPEYLASIARAIAKGVDHYLNKTPGISSMDLHE